MAEKGAYPPPSAPQGAFPEAPPSYEATVSGAAGKKNVRFLTVQKYCILNTPIKLFRRICRSKYGK